MVLLVRVSVVARPTIVSVEVGRVSVPVLLIVEITGAVSVLLVRVSVVVLPTYVSVPWKVRVVLSVPANVKVLLAVNVLPFAIVRVAEVAGCVRVSLLIVVVSTS